MKRIGARLLVGASSLAAIVAAAAMPFTGCQRYADLRDEPDASPIVTTPDLDAGDIPELDSGLASDAHPSCGGRPEGKCHGPVDFPCDFDGWASATAVSCDEATGCITNGFLEVTMATNGCVVAIGMNEPNDAMVACLIAEFGAVRCPCTEGTFTHFFGVGNTGPCP